MILGENFNRDGADQGWSPWDGVEKVDRELQRLWDSEIKDYFKAEGEFLRTYGVQAGYESSYIRRVLYDHEKLAELVREGGEENARLFSEVLKRLFRFKEEYLERHLDRMTGSGGTAPGSPSGGSWN